ncbi:MAG TPA: glycoside hydrolase family 127 protein [Pelobium sp.]|nr:glycoside hydrolase family 127 protein [Pelobium sp.]
MKNRNYVITMLFCLTGYLASAQQKALTNTSNSKFAVFQSPNMEDVRWTGGFWGDRFEVCRTAMIPHIWDTYMDADVSHAFKNFEIAAGLDTGQHKGPSFHDGDFYKVLEGVANMYAVTKDKKLDEMMDKAIAVIAKSQRADGYIYTQAMIEQRKTGEKNQFQDRLSFEAYNIGHLMTAGCVHYRATGKTNLLNVAKKATDYLYNFYQKASPTLARNAICPSHYMGTIEMYRTTKDPRYLELAKHLIAIKGDIDDGTDDNQDRIPFLKQTHITGHAVRANYLYAGVADLYAENGDPALLERLNMMWDDLTQHKMYITGGCGSLYDGVSPDGTSYNPTEVQKIHQAYGRPYQLPNFTAHNETCANIGNVLWNWRMLQITGDSKYADVMETALYNSVLSGISLDGTKFLYTNPLSYSDDLPFKQRWSKDRVPYISLSNCCPPNVVRTIAEVSDYAYSIGKNGLFVNLYGSNNLRTTLPNGEEIKLSQQTDYPWNGTVKINIQSNLKKAQDINFRIPGWCKTANILVNGKVVEQNVKGGQYFAVNGKWKKGDVIELQMPMEAKLVEANPMVEETRNQVAVKYGPVVYCAESKDNGNKVFDYTIPTNIKFQPEMQTIDGAKMLVLNGSALLNNQKSWINQLYREVNPTEEKANITLIPYYAWGNRGHVSEMSVWLPVSK